MIQRPLLRAPPYPLAPARANANARAQVTLQTLLQLVADRLLELADNRGGGVGGGGGVGSDEVAASQQQNLHDSIALLPGLQVRPRRPYREKPRQQPETT